MTVQLSQISPENDKRFHEMIVRLLQERTRQDDNQIGILSNIEVYYDLITLASSLTECNHRRRMMSQMNRERQNNMLDMFELLSDIVDTVGNRESNQMYYVGTVGLIKINRINREAAILFIFNRDNLKDFQQCLIELLQMAKSSFGLDRIHCTVIDDNSANLVTPILRSVNFCQCEVQEVEDKMLMTFGIEIVRPPYELPIRYHASPEIRLGVDSYYPQQSLERSSEDVWQVQDTSRGKFDSSYKTLLQSATAGFTYPSMESSVRSVTFNTNQDKELQKDSIDTASGPSAGFDFDSVTDTSKSSYLDPLYPHPLQISPNESFSLGSNSQRFHQPESPSVSSTISSIGNQDRDTKYDKICIFWLKGVCMYGSCCRYRHHDRDSAVTAGSEKETLQISVGEEKIPDQALPRDISTRYAQAYRALLEMVNIADAQWVRHIILYRCNEDTILFALSLSQLRSIRFPMRFAEPQYSTPNTFRSTSANAVVADTIESARRQVEQLQRLPNSAINDLMRLRQLNHGQSGPMSTFALTTLEQFVEVVSASHPLFTCKQLA